jgi:hypothetical protein
LLHAWQEHCLTGIHEEDHLLLAVVKVNLEVKRQCMEEISKRRAWQDESEQVHHLCLLFFLVDTCILIFAILSHFTRVFDSDLKTARARPPKNFFT